MNPRNRTIEALLPQAVGTVHLATTRSRPALDSVDWVERYFPAVMGILQTALLYPRGPATAETIAEVLTESVKVLLAKMYQDVRIDQVSATVENEVRALLGAAFDQTVHELCQERRWKDTLNGVLEGQQKSSRNGKHGGNGRCIGGTH